MDIFHNFDDLQIFSTAKKIYFEEFLLVERIFNYLRFIGVLIIIRR